MAGKSEQIDIGDASAGMLLAHDLKDSSGSVLLPAGASLSESNLASLRRRGIERIAVVGAAEPVDPAALQAERERKCARLVHLFRRSATVGATALLLERLIMFRSRDDQE